ncbi:hypothetical protein [Corallincola spongiicola]|uniref:DUF4124 domain-containing protein n=1 Tax=Corallincola spongiicola TaxID=2520508 RepID=A0ABY1WLS4_9GAMM|nr:hypothetical protein [Corallincola spongiicola]TAA41879.1 hypothetical protein EXY25_16745 [Corallincola spongiicola]
MQTKFRQNSFVIAGLITLLFSVYAEAKNLVYFWYDEAGVIHFAEQRPTGKRVYAVEMLDAPTEKKEKKYSYESLFQDEADEQATETELEKAQQEREMAAQRCDAAKHSLWILENKHFVRQENEDGTQTMLSYEEKQRIEKRSQQEVDKFCN